MPEQVHEGVRAEGERAPAHESRPTEHRLGHPEPRELAPRQTVRGEPRQREPGPHEQVVGPSQSERSRDRNRDERRQQVQRVEVQRSAVRMVDERTDVRVRVPVEDRVPDPPEVPVRDPGVAAGRHGRAKVERERKGEDDGKRGVCGDPRRRRQDDLRAASVTARL